MPLVPLPWQERTGDGTAQVTYSELMARDSARTVSVTIKPGPDGEPPYWDLYFGIGVNVRLYLTDETARKLVEEIEAQRRWYSERLAEVAAGQDVGMPKRTSSFRESLLIDLADPKEAAAYLTAALLDSEEMYLAALQDIADAQGAVVESEQFRTRG